MKNYNQNSTESAPLIAEPSTLKRVVVYKLYLNRVLSAWGDQTWALAVGLFLIKLNPGSLTLTAIQGILNGVTTILLSPLVGRWVQRSNRLLEAEVSLFLQNGSVAISSLFAALYFSKSAFSSDTYDQVIDIAAPVGLVIFSISAQFWSLAYTLVLEKDWLLALVSEDAELTKLNAMLRRIDLTCLTSAPFLVGWLLEYSSFWTAVSLAAWNVISAMAEYALLKSIHATGPDTIRAEKQQLEIAAPIRLFDVAAFRDYRREFFLPGLSFALLYLTVLGLDSVTIGFMSSEGVTDSLVGTVSLAAGASGVIGTLIFPAMVGRCGLRKTGVFGYIFEFGALLLCLVFIIEPEGLRTVTVGDMDVTILFFVLGLVISRAGLWIADLSVNQLIQTDTAEPALIGGVQNSANIFSDLVKFALVLGLPRIDQFWILVLVSQSAVGIAAIMFTVHVFSKPKPNPLSKQSNATDYGSVTSLTMSLPEQLPNHH